MIINDIFSVRFLTGFVIGIGILVFLGAGMISKVVGARVEDYNKLLKEIQKADGRDLEKMEQYIKEIVSISGVRG